MPDRLIEPPPASRRRAIGRAALASCAALLVAACAAAGTGPDRITIATPAGTRQCEPAGGDALKAAMARLGAAGIDASAPRCGHDGRVRAAMCGLADGRIVIVDIASNALPEARAAGWTPLAELPGAETSPCR